MLICSLKNTLQKEGLLSRGQKKRMKKKQKVLTRTILEEKMAKDAQGYNRANHKMRRHK